MKNVKRDMLHQLDDIKFGAWEQLHAGIPILRLRDALQATRTPLDNLTAVVIQEVIAILRRKWR